MHIQARTEQSQSHSISITVDHEQKCDNPRERYDIFFKHARDISATYRGAKPAIMGSMLNEAINGSDQIDTPPAEIIELIADYWIDLENNDLCPNLLVKDMQRSSLKHVRYCKRSQAASTCLYASLLLMKYTILRDNTLLLGPIRTFIMFVAAPLLWVICALCEVYFVIKHRLCVSFADVAGILFVLSPVVLVLPRSIFDVIIVRLC